MIDQLEIFDPRAGNFWESRDYLTGHRFSTHEHPFIVCSGVAPKWFTLAHWIGTLSSSATSGGFLAIAPSARAESAVFKALRDMFPAPAEFNHSAFIQYVSNQTTSRLLADLWSLHGGWSSGVWCFGGANASFSNPKRIGNLWAEEWGLAHLLKEPEKIEFALELGELHQITLLLRITEGVDDMFAKLRQSETG
jgi:hypothetical protein